MSHFQIVLFSFLLTLLIILAAFFSLAETALMAANRYRIRHKARLKKRYAVRLLGLLKRPDRMLGAILIGNTFANMIASSLATLIAFHFWGEKGAVAAAFALTFIFTVFTEITPKTLAALYADKIVRWTAFPIQYLLQLMYPIVWLANTISNGVLRCIGINVHSIAAEPLSREELRSVVYDTAGRISRQYQNMLLTILDLNKLTVDDLMIPRHEIVGINVENSWEDILQEVSHLNQTAIPFYRGNMNQIVGVLYAKNLLPLLCSEQQLDQVTLFKLMHEPYFVPQGTLLSVQLTQFQQHKDKTAFIVDEYGEILGLLTLNDILEEIVGNFTSSATPGKRIEQQKDGSYMVDAGMTVREFNRITEWELPTRGPRTLNGIIIEYLETMPRTGTCVLIAGYPIEITQVRENRVKYARIFKRLSMENS